MDTIPTPNQERHILSVILGEYGRMMSIPGNTTAKFILIAVGIEFLGTCLDRRHTQATARSEKRFNLALSKLFPERYHHFTRKEAIPNLYLDFRCPVIHQFAVPPSVRLEPCADRATGIAHLAYDSDGALILVAEDFYRDLAVAGKELIKRL
jgi:hypothetical protein